MSEGATGATGEQLNAAIHGLRKLIDRALADGEVEGLKQEELQELVSAAARLYAVACEREGVEVPPTDGTIAATEALVLACALLRSQDLTPFDLSLWFSRGDPNLGGPLHAGR